MKTILAVGFAVCMLACNNTPKQTQQQSAAVETKIKLNDALRTQLKSIDTSSGGTVGVAIAILGTKDTLSLNNIPAYPMHSVFKFPIAMAVLNLVDSGKLQLDQKIFIDKSWLKKDTYSPLRDTYPKGNIQLTIARLIQYSVSESDNIACDILIKLAGGENAINKFIHDLGVTQMNIEASEARMAEDWDAQFRNWCTPEAAVQLLDILDKGTALKPATNNFLWKTMLETTTGARRLKYLLPAGTPVAHKTGTSGSDHGVTIATNDIGIIVLPDGRKLAIAVFVMNSAKDEAGRESTIAQMAKAAYDSAIH